MAVDNVSAGTSTAGSLSPDSSVSGTIDAGMDQDWYRISLTGGRFYRFDLQGLDSALGTLDDPLLRLLDANGTEIIHNDDAGDTLESSISFVAPRSATYYLSAQAFLSSTGTFRLTATDITVVANDVPANTGTTATLATDAQLNGTIDASGDQDWYRVSLTQGRQYRFDLQGSSSGQGTLEDPLLRLLDSAGAEITVSDDVGSSLDSSISFTATRTADYFLSAQGFDIDIGTYTLRASDLTSSGTEDVAGGTGTTSMLAVGAAVTGAIDTGNDQDWYRVSLTQGRQYRFDLQGASGDQGTLADPMLRLLNQSGQELARNDDSGGNLDSSFSFLADRSGTYYLSAESFADDLGTFQLRATDIGGSAGDVPANSGTTAGIDIDAEPVTGIIDSSGDQDWFRLSLEAGHNYRFNLQGAASGQGSLVDPFLRLLDASGTELTVNDDYSDSLESSIAFSPAQSGTYFLSAQGYDTSTGTFTLGAIDLTSGAGDVPASTASASGVAIRGSMPGNIDFSGDQDWFRVFLQAGQSYTFSLLGSESAWGSLEDPLMRLLDSAGNELAFNDDSEFGLESELEYVSSRTGVHFLSAQAFASDIGSYTIFANDYDTTDVRGDSSTDISLSIGGSVSGFVDEDGDQDWYRLELVAGRNYYFDLTGFDSGFDTLADPYLRLLNSSGQEIAFNDDAGSGLESRITFSATQSGTYYLSAEGYAGVSSGSFTLNTWDATVDVPASQATTRGVLIGDSLSGTIDVAGDSDWFVATLQAGHQYVFEMQGAWSGLGSLEDSYLRLLDLYGELLAFDDDSGAEYESRLVFEPEWTDTYFLAAEGFSASTGTFSLSAFDVDDLGDTPGGTVSDRTIPLGGSVNDNIGENGDEDWYELTLIAGRQYRFSQFGFDSGLGSLEDPLLRLLDSDGNELAFDDDSGTGFEPSLAFTAPQTGRYYLSAQAYELGNGTYTLMAEDLSTGTGDIAANTGTTAAIAVNGSVYGTLDFEGDQDWHRISLQAGREYQFGLTGMDSTDGTLADPYLVLFDSAGNWIAEDDDSGTGLESSLSFTADQSGDFFIAAQGFETSTGTYVLSASDGSRDVAGGPWSSAAVAVGGGISGMIDYEGDQDWYRVLLLAGHEYRVDLRGADSGQGTLNDPLLRLLDQQGEELLMDDDSGLNVEAVMQFEVNESNIYLVSAEAFATETGTFSLTVTDLSLETADIAANIDSDAAISVDGTIFETIEAGGDQDWYRIALHAGQQYRFDLSGESSELGTLGDPLIRLLDESGIEIAFNDDRDTGLDSSLVYTASQSGGYFLSAQAFGPETGTYALSVIRLSGGPSDVAANLQTDGAITLEGFVSGEINTAGDSDWYLATLQTDHQYQFDLLGADSFSGTLGDPLLRLLDQNGNEIFADDDSGFGLESSLIATVTEGGDFYLSAEGFGSDTGTFALTATDLTNGTVTERTVTGTAAAEQLIGSEYNDNIQGFAGADLLDGKDGQDLIDGGAGNDVLSGGLGDDVIYGGDGDDLFPHTTGESTGNDSLFGGNGNDTFEDFLGNNEIDGGPGDDTFVVFLSDDDGSNVVTGDTGRDNYLVYPRMVADNSQAFVVTDFEIGLNGDVLDLTALIDASIEDRYFVEGSSELSDFVRLSQSGSDAHLQWDPDGSSNGDYDWITLLSLKNTDADKLESSNYRGGVEYGTKDNDQLDGSLGNDLLAGADGSDTLNGGPGADVMVGGNGDDRYFVDDLKDTVVEETSTLSVFQVTQLGIDPAAWKRIAGDIDPKDIADDIDEVIATVSFTLTAFVENLSLVGADGIDGTGNELDNVIVGNAADNVLRSGEGDVDRLSGNDGNDTFVIDKLTGRTIVEDTTGGTDTLDLSVFAAGDSAAQLSISSGPGNRLLIENSSGGVVEVLDFFAGSKPLEFIDVGNGPVGVANAASATALSALLSAPADPDSLLLDGDPLYQSRIMSADGHIIEGEMAQIFRQYLGGLGREPAAGGYAFWWDRIEDGRLTFRKAAQQFIDSPEFGAKADTDRDDVIADEEFVDHMYFNVFGRAPAEGGRNFWLNSIDRSSQAIAFTNMLQSPEFVEKTALDISEWPHWDTIF